MIMTTYDNRYISNLQRKLTFTTAQLDLARESAESAIVAKTNLELRLDIAMKHIEELQKTIDRLRFEQRADALINEFKTKNVR